MDEEVVQDQPIEAPLVDCVVYSQSGNRPLNDHKRCQVYLTRDRDILLIRMMSGAEHSYVIRNISGWRTYPIVD